ncbi:MAG TPA: polyprenyl synthetase family protein [Frankiaceae bacterium]|jgi:geranylgeranyl diphosphate synthase type I
MSVLTLPSLTESRATVLPAMREALDRLDPTSRALASYHLGWTDAEGRPREAPGGKAVRPALALLSAQAAGAPALVGVPGAVAVELVHNFSLLHDDLMDGDVERRHRPTVWALWGPASAILTGDALLTLATQVLLDAETPQAAAATRLLAEATQELMRGQVEDLAFERRDDVTAAECVAMAGGKTAALLRASAAIGAVLAGAPSPVVEGLSVFGWELGLAFQFVDDLLGIWGESSQTGKPVLNDLRSRKKSLPVTFAMRSGTAAGEELARWISADGEPTEADLRHAADLVVAAGGRDWAVSEAQRRMAVGEQALGGLGLAPPVHEALCALGRFVVGREF